MKNHPQIQKSGVQRRVPVSHRDLTVVSEAFPLEEMENVKMLAPGIQ